VANATPAAVLRGGCSCFKAYPRVALSGRGDFFFRSRGLRSAHSKTIPRRLRETDTGFASKFLAAFDALFTEKRNAPVVALVEELLAPFGGPLFDGFRMNAREKVMSDE
jgi:hypothetical protein